MAKNISEIFAHEQTQRYRKAEAYHRLLIDLHHDLEVDPEYAVSVAKAVSRSQDDVERDLKNLAERYALVDRVTNGDEVKPTLREIEGEIQAKSDELAEIQREKTYEIEQLQQVKYELADRVANGDNARERLLKTVLDQSITMEMEELQQRRETLWSSKDETLLIRYRDLLAQNEAVTKEATDQLREVDPDADQWLADPNADTPPTGSVDRISLVNQARRAVRLGLDSVEEKRRVVDGQREKYANAQDAMQAINARLAELRQRCLQP